MSLWWSLGEDPPASNASTPHSRIRRPLSSFFHSTSVIGSQTGSDTIQPSPKPISPNPTRLELPRLDMSHLSPGLPAFQRSPTSTRSIIDHISPRMSTRPLSSVTQRSPVSPLWETQEDLRRPSVARVIDYGGNVPLTQISPEPQRHSPCFTALGSRRRQENQRQGSRPSARSERRRRAQNQVQTQTCSGGYPRWKPKHCRGRVWFPAMESSAVRSKLLHTLVSGAILALVLLTSLALSATNPTSLAQFRIILILFLLVFGVLFTHSLLTLFLLVRRYRKYGLASLSTTRGSGSDASGSRGGLRRCESFAHIDRPIHVILARDEEFGLGAGGGMGVRWREMDVNGDGGESEGLGMGMKEMAPPPPAYGRWRGSVRADPNLLHWQRNEHPSPNQNQTSSPAPPPPRRLSEASAGTMAPRPPSYTPPVGHAAAEEDGEEEERYF